MVEGVPDRWIVLIDEQGRRRVDTSVPPGAPMPPGLPELLKDAQRAGAGRSVYVSDLTRTSLNGRPIVGVVLPVPHPGRPTWRLAIVLAPDVLQQILTEQGLPQGWFATLLDRRDRVMARSLDSARYLGRPVPLESYRGLQRPAPKGVFEGRAFEGYSTLVAYRRSPLTGWTLTVAMPSTAAQAQLIRSLALTLALELALSLLGVALVWRFGGRIARAVGRLAQSAEALGQGAPVAPQVTGLSETDAVGSALHDASVRLREREARIRRLVESNIIGVFFWTMEGDVTEANDAFLALVGYSREDLRAGRLRWDTITPPEWQDADRRTMELVRAQRPAKPYEKEYIRKDGRRVPVLIGPAAYAGTGEKGVAFVVDLTEQKETQQRLKLMVDELNHRVKNTLATVMAISAQTRRTAPSPDAFHQAFQGRLAALSKTHNLLNESFWAGVTLRQLVEQALAPYAAGDRTVVEGEEIRLGPIVSVTLGMALYELASNAAKYGALSAPSGRVAVSWRPSAPGRLELEWAESGGAPVMPPERRGFGTQLIEKVLAAELHGEVRLEFRPEGVRCVMDMALDRLSAH
jgi:PAS domain S-box-containing protein